MVEVGDIAPQFCLPDAQGEEVCLDALLGRWTVLYFYPKDNTSGCTKEALDFSAALEDLRSLGAEVVGVSPDSQASHQKFIEKHGLKVVLLSDPDHKALEAYGVWAKKKMYGKEHYGVVRSTFLIDPQGKVAGAWRKVKVKGHVEEVKERLLERKGEG